MRLSRAEQSFVDRALRIYDRPWLRWGYARSWIGTIVFGVGILGLAIQIAWLKQPPHWMIEWTCYLGFVMLFEGMICFLTRLCGKLHAELQALGSQKSIG